MRNSAFGLWVAILSISFAACAASTPPALGGETNWLKRCSDGERCERGSCICGVCTAPCNADNQCTGGFAGTCISALEKVGSSACDDATPAPPAGLCLPVCMSDAACGNSFACREGVCVTDVAAMRADAARGSTVPPNTDAGIESPATARADADPVEMQEPPATQPNAMLTPVAPMLTPAAGDPVPPPVESPCPDGIYVGNAEIRRRSDIERLRGCSRVAGDMVIISSDLEDLSGLESLHTIEGRLTVAHNDQSASDLTLIPTTIPPPTLKSVKGLEGLQTVGSLALVGLQITTLEPLSALQTAPRVWLNDMSGLRDLKGLDKLDWETLDMARNGELLSLSGLRVQASRHAALVVSDSPKLSDLKALQGLVSVSENIALSSLDIADLSGLGALQSVGDAVTGRGGLSIAGCARLRDLSGLGQLKSTAGLVLSGNENLETLGGMALTAPPSTLGITGSPRLASLAPAIPAGAWNAHAVNLERLPGLKSLSDLRALQSAASLMIQYCDGLKDLTGLEQLKTGGFVFIMYCAGLTDLTGLDNLTTIMGPLAVGGNPALTSVRQLGGLKSFAAIEIRDNVMLPQCEVDWLARRLNTTLNPDLNGPSGMCAP